LEKRFLICINLFPSCEIPINTLGIIGALSGHYPGIIRALSGHYPGIIRQRVWARARLADHGFWARARLAGFGFALPIFLLRTAMTPPACTPGSRPTPPNFRDRPQRPAAQFE
jgi:hypothetical protein